MSEAGESVQFGSQARMFGGGGQEVDEAREKAESDRSPPAFATCCSAPLHVSLPACREQQRRARLESLRKQGEASLLRTDREILVLEDWSGALHRFGDVGISRLWFYED